MGSIILCASVLIGGLLLCTDYALPRMAALVTRKAWRYAAAGRNGWRLARSGHLLRRTNASPRTLDDGDEEELAVRIGGRRVTATAALEDDEQLDDQVVDAEEEAIAEDDEEAAAVEDSDDSDEEESEGEEDVAAGTTNPALLQTRDGKLIRADVPAIAPEPRIRYRNDDRETVKQTLDVASELQDAEEYELPPVDLLIRGDDVCCDSQERKCGERPRSWSRLLPTSGTRSKSSKLKQVL
jgi:hypothetical protein